MPDSPLAAWLQAQDPGREPGGAGTAAALSGPEQDDEGGMGGPRDPLGPLDLGATPGTRQDLWDLSEPPPSGRMRRLLVVAALPLMAVLLVAGALAANHAGTDESTGRPTEVAVVPSAGGTGEEVPDASVSSAAMSTAPDAPTQPEAAPVAPGETMQDALLAVAELHVRAALSGPPEPGTGTEPARARYADTAVATAVTRVDDVAIVTVIALLLEGGPQGWDTARPVRYALALREGVGGPQPLGAPWAVNLPEGSPPSASPIDPEPALVASVGAALEAAGYSGLQGLAVARSEAPHGVLLARVRGLAPGARDPADHEVWLTDDPSPVVLGR